MTKQPNAIDKHVGSRLRLQRRNLAMSQTRLARALGLSFQQVQKYEKGLTRIGASRLQQIGDILHVPVPFFFEGTPTVASAEADDGVQYVISIQAFLASEDAAKLAQAFLLVKTSGVRRSIVKLVQEIADRQVERRRILKKGRTGATNSQRRPKALATHW